MEPVNIVEQIRTIPFTSSPEVLSFARSSKIFFNLPLVSKNSPTHYQHNYSLLTTNYFIPPPQPTQSIHIPGGFHHGEEAPPPGPGSPRAPLAPVGLGKAPASPDGVRVTVFGFFWFEICFHRKRTVSQNLTDSTPGEGPVGVNTEGGGVCVCVFDGDTVHSKL